MLPLKILIVGIVLAGLIGIAGVAVVAGGDRILGEDRALFRGSGGWGGGGCGGYDRDDVGNYPSCHRNNADYNGSCKINGTCPYYDNRTT